MIQINGQRLLSELEKQKQIGWLEGKGLFRPGYSKEYLEARNYLCQKMEEAKFRVRVDSVGNLFARLEGHDPTAPTILTGSHLDSVDGGGYLDGPLGVFGGLEALRAIQESGIRNKHTLEVAAFIAEEGGELGGTFGSRAFTGKLKTKPEEKTLSAYGLSVEDLERCKMNTDDYAAFIELHIEQGPFLWREKIPIGIPYGIVSIRRCKVSIRGVANHAGTTPMYERKDALYEGSWLIHEWLKFMRTEKDVVGNVGFLDVQPGVISVVPGELEIGFEIRSMQIKKIELAIGKIHELLGQLSLCKGSISRITEKPPVLLDKKITDAIEKVCENLGFKSMSMSSWASHDANPIASIVPAGMIFTPSIGGISHAKEEKTEDQDIVRGVEVLTNTLILLDEQL